MVGFWRVGDCAAAIITWLPPCVCLCLSETGQLKIFVKWENKPRFILVTDQSALREKRFYFCTKWCRWKKKACEWELLRHVFKFTNHNSYHIFSWCLQPCIERPRQVSIVHKPQRSFLRSVIFCWTAGKLPYTAIRTPTVRCRQRETSITNKEVSHASKQINV